MLAPGRVPPQPPSAGLGRGGPGLLCSLGPDRSDLHRRGVLSCSGSHSGVTPSTASGLPGTLRTALTVGSRHMLQGLALGAHGLHPLALAFLMIVSGLPSFRKVKPAPVPLVPSVRSVGFHVQPPAQQPPRPELHLQTA